MTNTDSNSNLKPEPEYQPQPQLELFSVAEETIDCGGQRFRHRYELLREKFSGVSQRSARQIHRSPDDTWLEILFTILCGEGRLAEWGTSLVLFLLGIVLVLPGNTFTMNTSYILFNEVIGDDTYLAIPFIIVALVRFAALYVNGRWNPSPIIRAAGACTGAMIYAALTAGLFFPYVAGLTFTLPLSVAAFGVLTLLDQVSSWRAGIDANLYQQ